jgi:ribulose-5-phosphate 4-epimerase/fuculose-1-phosphate aldolase
MVNDIINMSVNISKYCVGMEGNISAKKDDKTFYIKASGSKLSKINEDHLVLFDFEGNQLSNFNKKGSMELGFHTFLLKFDGINFISHTHPVNTLKILCSNYSEIFANNRLFPDQVIFNGVKSCLVTYAKPGDHLTNKVKENVNSFIEKEGFFPKLILLQNHGIIACGKTSDECLIITEICEKSAEIFLGSILLGNVKFLSDDETNDLINDKKEKYRQDLLK